MTDKQKQYGVDDAVDQVQGINDKYRNTFNSMKDLDESHKGNIEAQLNELHSQLKDIQINIKEFNQDQKNIVNNKILLIEGNIKTTLKILKFNKKPQTVN